MHQHLLKKFERESKAMKRLSMNNEELMWKLSQSDVGPLDHDDADRAPATTRDAAGGMFMSATLPSRAGRRAAAPGSAAMSRSYDSPRAMFAAPSSGPRWRGSRPTPTKQRPETTSAAVKTDSERAPSSMSDSAASRLRRSGTYDVVDDK